ncbi:MAG: hypothetical protein QUU85_10830, partial [Candidatus Eisenbacteria bacterium]|nr:hypothetical protein [Candidatus Eisenbacteria bacterium]
MTWFEDLTGFRETSAAEVRERLLLDGETITSTANGRVMRCGRLETPSLGELRSRVRDSGAVGGQGPIRVREVVANVAALHADEANAGALFQVASQFNLLEMVSPSVTPERGVGIYENDHTQGPACAVAAGAGTIYRNYFAPVRGKVGQSSGNQIDCLADLGERLGNAQGRLWQMRNGYALPSRAGLSEIAEQLHGDGAQESERDQLRSLLRIGIQWDTQVTLRGCEHLVSQAYCSALPVAYTDHPAELWEPFARLVLEAAYEATLCAAILNRRATGNRRAFLTLLGGGAFGNATPWITDALKRACLLYTT